MNSLGVWLRSLFLLLALVVSALSFSLSYLILLLVLPRKFLWRYWVRPWAWWCLRVAGQKVKIEGNYPDQKNGPYLYLLNHESLFDALLMGYTLKDRATGLCAKNYFYLPIWGWMMWLHGVIPVERNNHLKAIGSVSEAEKAVARGESIVVCPEGRRSDNGEVQEFKSGAAHLAKNTKVTIVPCVVRGTFQSWNRNSWLISPNIITLRFLEPLPYAVYIKEYERSGIAGITNLVKAKIVAGKAGLSNKPGDG